MITNSLIIFCDGGARGNPGEAACAFVVKKPTGEIIHQASQSLGRATNNEAEYQGVITALKWLLLKQNQLLNFKINFFLDSKLVVNQLNGLFKIKNARLRELIFLIKTLESQLNNQIFYQFIPREENQLADQLLNQNLDMKKGVKTI
jgi:ribonuclease HI